MTYKRTTTDESLDYMARWKDESVRELVTDLRSCEQALAAAERCTRAYEHTLEEVEEAVHTQPGENVAEQVRAMAKALAAAERGLQDLEDEISEPSFEDERIKYVEVQISRKTWLALKAKRAARAEEQR